jgi:hypothetical protein
MNHEEQSAIVNAFCDLSCNDDAIIANTVAQMRGWPVRADGLTLTEHAEELLAVRSSASSTSSLSTHSGTLTRSPDTSLASGFPSRTRPRRARAPRAGDDTLAMSPDTPLASSMSGDDTLAVSPDTSLASSMSRLSLEERWPDLVKQVRDVDDTEVSGDDTLAVSPDTSLASSMSRLSLEERWPDLVKQVRDADDTEVEKAPPVIESWDGAIIALTQLREEHDCRIIELNNEIAELKEKASENIKLKRDIILLKFDKDRVFEKGYEAGLRDGLDYAAPPKCCKQHGTWVCKCNK